MRFPAQSDDTAILVQALRALGAAITWEPVPMEVADPLALHASSGAVSWQVRVRGINGQLAYPAGGRLQMGNAGAVLRLLLGLGALLPEVTYVTDHPESLGRRPNRDLLDALADLGVASQAQDEEGRLPITLRGGSPQGGSITVSGSRSSQYLSALLYLAPLLQGGLDIQVVGDLRSRPMVRATIRSLACAGIQVEASEDLMWFHVPGAQVFQARTYEVPGDGPTAAALVAAAIALNRPLLLSRLACDEPDVIALVDALRNLGVPVTFGASESEGSGLGRLLVAEVSGDSTHPQLHGARIDGDSCIDSVPVLTALACFVDGESTFERVSTLRWKESDRIGDLSDELRRAGCLMVPGDDSFVVWGQSEGIVGGVSVDGHDDHRLVQALAIVALRSRRGLTIHGADAVAKSYPEFFITLQQLGGHVHAFP